MAPFYDWPRISLQVTQQFKNSSRMTFHIDASIKVPSLPHLLLHLCLLLVTMTATIVSNLIPLCTPFEMRQKHKQQSVSGLINQIVGDK